MSGELSQRFNVSEDSFAAICASWRRRETAVAMAGHRFRRLRQLKRAKAQIDQQAVARAAAALIQPGQVVIVDGGTTTAAMIGFTRRPQLHGGHHSPRIAVALVDHPRIEVILAAQSI